MRNTIPFFVFFLTFGLFTSAFSQDLTAYRLFDKHGKKARFKKMLDQSASADIVLFGELHNNPISHWVQYELTQQLYGRKDGKLILGAEMFEADNQLIIDEYFSGLIPERSFKAEARLWNNYDTDYKPLLEFARSQQIPFVATNIPRRYAGVVNRLGFEGLERLDETAKSWIAPLPVPYDAELPAYKAMLNMGQMPGHANENFPKAQAIKDATMAWFILQNFIPSHTFLHFHGTYHSNNYEGIYWYLNTYQPGLKMITIATVEQSSLDKLDEKYMGLADFILVVPVNMTKTY